MTTEQINEVIGKNLNDVRDDVDFGSCWPLIDPETMIIERVVDGNYPDGTWTTGAFVDGVLKTGDHYVDFAVEL